MFPRLFKRALSTGATEIKPKVLVGNEKYILGIVLGMSMFSIGTYLDTRKTIDRLESRIDSTVESIHFINHIIEKNIGEITGEIAAVNKKVDATHKKVDDTITLFNDINKKVVNTVNKLEDSYRRRS